MKTTKAVLALAALLFCLLATESAFAWHRGGRVGVGLYFGVPVAGWGYYYPPPYYYYPPYYPPATVIVPSQPQSYVEQGAPQAAPQAAPQPQPAQGYWYYCPDSRAYYPYVRDCPAGWQRVSPTPQS